VPGVWALTVSDKRDIRQAVRVVRVEKEFMRDLSGSMDSICDIETLSRTGE
jgi:hypothetical protein